MNLISRSLVTVRLSRMAKWCVLNRSRIHYSEVRPIPVDLSFGELPFTTDCSGFVTMLARWAGLPDPNGLGYSGSGYTGTLLTHLLPIPSSSQPGAVIRRWCRTVRKAIPASTGFPTRPRTSVLGCVCGSFEWSSEPVGEVPGITGVDDSHVALGVAHLASTEGITDVMLVP